MAIPTGKIERHTVHEDHIEARLNSQELYAVILEHVAKRANVTLGRRGVTTKIVFEDETEGSPPYKDGTKAKVSITVDYETPAETAQ